MTIHASTNDGGSAFQHLQELIDALDRSVAQMERVGETAVAADGLALKNKALARIAQLRVLAWSD